MTDEQAVAIMAAIFLAADNVRGGLNGVEDAVRQVWGDGWNYDSDAGAIEHARELLNLVRTGIAS